MVSILATQNPQEFSIREDYQQIDSRVDPGVLEFTFDPKTGTLTEKMYRAPGSDVAYIEGVPYLSRMSKIEGKSEYRLEKV